MAMKRTVVITSLLLLLVANVLMVYRVYYANVEAFQNNNFNSTAYRSNSNNNPIAKANIEAFQNNNFNSTAYRSNSNNNPIAKANIEAFQNNNFNSTAYRSNSNNNPIAKANIEAFQNNNFNSTAYRSNSNNNPIAKANIEAFQNTNSDFEYDENDNNEGFASYFLENSSGTKDTFKPMGAYDGIQLPTGNASAWRYTSPNEKLMGDAFSPGPDSLFMFKNNQCKPECCGASFSCGGGCVCTTPDQRQYIASRGGNRTAPEDSA